MKYDRPVHELMKDMAKSLNLQAGRTFDKRDAVKWFADKYPAINRNTVEAHLTRMSVNAPSRLHYNAVPDRDDLFFKIDPSTFRLYDRSVDPQPIWSKEQTETIGVNKRRAQTSRLDYSDRVTQLLENSDTYHAAFYSAAVFTGPSLYFHQRALAKSSDLGDSLYLEYIYATLVAWGMHRMGAKGSKMLPFEDFKGSIDDVSDEIHIARKMQPSDMRDSDWHIVKNIFSRIKVMATGTSIVGNSKVMAHLMPNLIPPIDRAYTLTFLRASIQNGMEHEWSLFRGIIEDLFIPVATDAAFTAKAQTWMKSIDTFPWDTSPMKIVDNLIIGAIRHEARQYD